MRFLIGAITLIFVLTGAILTVLAIWGIQPISWTIVWKSGITIMIIGLAILISKVVYYFFLKRDPFGLKKKNNE